MLWPLLGIPLVLWAAPAPPGRILLVPCGPVDPALLDFVAAGVAQEFGIQVSPAREMPVPQHAYDPRRRQYLADTFLHLLKSYRTGSQELVLGVTPVDLFAGDYRLNFVLGLADFREGCAVISLARLQPEFFGRKSDRALWQIRALKEANHELGHLLGLGHCSQASCVMFFSNTVADTDGKGPGFCSRCRERLQKR